ARRGRPGARPPGQRRPLGLAGGSGQPRPGRQQPRPGAGPVRFLPSRCPDRRRTAALAPAIAERAAVPPARTGTITSAHADDPAGLDMRTRKGTVAGQGPATGPAPGEPARAEPMLLYVVKQVELAVRSRLDDLLRPAGLTVLQYTALTVLERHPDLSSAQLARNSFVT